MQKVTHRTQSFDGFTLDLTRGCLLRGVQEIKLRPKPFEALKYLVQNPGRLISKTELIQTIWPDTAVTDDSLVQCLMEVRRALGDDGQQIIKTVPRRGYIFDKEVSEKGAFATYTEETTGVHVVIEEAEETNGHAAVEAIESLPRRNEIAAPRKQAKVASLIGAIKRHKIATAVASAALAALVIAGVFFAKPILFWWFKPPSIAVLAIVNATGDPNNDYVSDGLTESLIRSLAQINEPGKFPRLLVTAQNTVFAFKGREPRSLGRELGVDTVVASKMIEQNGMWIIKAEMIKVVDGSEVWSKQYSVRNRGPNDFPQLQDDIARDIAAKLPLTLSSEERQRLTRRYTQNPEAYDAYLKGRAAWRKATPAGFKKSIEYYQQAIDLDPNFALAYVGMGASYMLQGIIGEMSMKDATDKGVELSLKALKIDNTLRPAKGLLQQAEMFAWDWEAIKKAGPQHAAYADYLIAMGRLDERLAFENNLLSFDPHNPLLNFLHAVTLAHARQYDAAIEQYQKTLKLGSEDGKLSFGPETPGIHFDLGHIYIQKGMFTEAFAELNEAKNLMGDLPAGWESLGYAYAKSGQRDEAIKILNQLQERAGRGEYVQPIGIAWIYTALGDKDQAFVWLDKAFADRSYLLRYVKTEAMYDPLRSDPRFTDLLRRMHLPT
jgi:DNA-binding winged helix-turn-helix (wHTH) protein/TolB-like protein/Tfp pilus assembly protein PilF